MVDVYRSFFGSFLYHSEIRDPSKSSTYCYRRVSTVVQGFDSKWLTGNKFLKTDDQATNQGVVGSIPASRTKNESLQPKAAGFFIFCLGTRLSGVLPPDLFVSGVL